MSFFSLILACFRVLILSAKWQKKNLEHGFDMSHDCHKAMIMAGPAPASVLNILLPMLSLTFGAPDIQIFLQILELGMLFSALGPSRMLFPRWSAPNPLVHSWGLFEYKRQPGSGDAPWAGGAEGLMLKHPWQGGRWWLLQRKTRVLYLKKGSECWWTKSWTVRLTDSYLSGLYSVSPLRRHTPSALLSKAHLSV